MTSQSFVLSKIESSLYNAILEAFACDKNSQDNSSPISFSISFFWDSRILNASLLLPIYNSTPMVFFLVLTVLANVKPDLPIVVFK